MKKLLLVLLFAPLVSFGQTKEELQLCLAAQSRSFTSDSEADNALDRILNVIGASKNFVLIPCSEINNAMATSYKGIRYILYDKAFMQLINSRTNDWSSLTILAHEVGHHINGHALDITMYAGGVVEAKSLAAQRKMELEADEFAAFIMAKLGAPLNQVESAISLITNDKDDTYSTHPSRSKRLNALRIGYNKAGVDSRQKNDYVADNSMMSVEQYYNRGIQKMDSQDSYGAIEDYDAALRIKPDYANALFKRAYPKLKLKNYLGAIADLYKFLDINPNESNAYFNVALAKFALKDYYGAITDYSKGIKINPDDGAYNGRGLSKKEINDHYGAIADFTKAIELNPNSSNAYANRAFSKSKLEDNYGAISDYGIYIELVPDDADAYFRRGYLKSLLGDEKGACADFTIAASYGDQDAAEWVRYECDSNKNTKPKHTAEFYTNNADSKYDLLDYQGAIADYSKAIELKPYWADPYARRGHSKYALLDYIGARADVSKAIEKDPGFTQAYKLRGQIKRKLLDYQGAIVDYSKAIELDRYYTHAYLLRGNTKLLLKDYRGAMADYSKAIELDPDYDAAYFNRGLVKHELKYYQGACNDWRKAVSLGSLDSAKSLRDHCN